MAGSVERRGSQPPEVLLEVQPSSTSGDLSPRSAVPEVFHYRADEIAASISQVVERFRTGLAQTLDRSSHGGWGVETIEIGFDISVQAESGVVIAKATTGATFTARLTIKAKPEPSS